MDSEIPDDVLIDLVEAGREEIGHDPELTAKAQEQISVDMGSLVEKIISELGLR